MIMLPILARTARSCQDYQDMGRCEYVVDGLTLVEGVGVGESGVAAAIVPIATSSQDGVISVLRSDLPDAPGSAGGEVAHRVVDRGPVALSRMSALSQGSADGLDAGGGSPVVSALGQTLSGGDPDVGDLSGGDVSGVFQQAVVHRGSVLSAPLRLGGRGEGVHGFGDALTVVLVAHFALEAGVAALGGPVPVLAPTLAPVLHTLVGNGYRHKGQTGHHNRCN